MDTANRVLHADLLVIGFGKGGKTVAAKMGRLGKRVVLVEQSERMYGGTCPNVGCVPTKGLVHRSHQRRPDDPVQNWYQRSVQEVQTIREMMRRGNFDALDSLETVTVLTGLSTFIDPHSVRVVTAGERLTVSADTILIDTGSEPIVPDVPGLADSKHTLTSTDLIETTTLPERLAIVGGGYLGIEFASIYRAFGSQVTMIHRAARILGREDDDIAAVATSILAGEGIEIVTGAHVSQVYDGESGATVVYDKDGQRHSVEVDAILAAAGRGPATHDLGLEVAGIRATDAGAIEVDEYLRTSQPHIYAVGDVKGEAQFTTYLSLDDGRVVLDQLTGQGRRTTADRVVVPRILFMTPPLATVGMTEREAREAGHRVKIASQPVAEIVAMPRAYAVEETRGVMKFVIDAETDEILGAALLSVDAQEIINTVALAMRHGIKAAELREAVYTHPSSTEAFNDVLASILRVDEP